MTTLVESCLLDPRPTVDAQRDPLAGAVNIPLAEIADRVHELPPPESPLDVVGAPELVESAIVALRSLGRRASPATTGDPRKPTTVGSPCVVASGVRWRLWRPSAFLESVVACLAPGRALDLGCGSGRDSVFLAAAGWSVVAVDRLPDALAIGRDLATRYLDVPGAIQWVQADFDRDHIDGAAPCELVIMIRCLNRRLLCSAADWLAPGGSVVVETFTTLHRERHGKPARDADVLEHGELPKLLRGLEIREHSEAWRDEAHTARARAVAPAPTAPWSAASSRLRGG